jgi:hypothetical protein
MGEQPNLGPEYDDTEDAPLGDILKGADTSLSDGEEGL